MVILKEKNQRFKFKKSREVQLVPMRLDISTLNALIGLTFKKSAQITRKSLTNLQKLMDIIDDRLYSNREDLSDRFDLIKVLLEARLTEGIENDGLLIEYCATSGTSEDLINLIPIYARLSYSDITGLNKAISERLNFAYIYLYREEFEDILVRIESGDYKSIRAINKEMADLCKDFINESRKISLMDGANAFSLSEDDYEDKLEAIFEELKNPSRTLSTGIKALNSMLGDGYQSGRLYTYVGLPAGFKSGVLLKTVLDIKEFNKDAPTKIPGARKTVLFITLENTISETVERMFNMSVCDEPLKDYTPKQLMQMVKKHGAFKIEGDNDIDIVLQYYPNYGIDTNDIYSIVAEIEDNGGEVIALILDYLKRIKPAAAFKDEKESLKHASNELKNIAVELDIPVITAHQLNREAASTIDAGVQSNKADLARTIGRSNIGSAWEIQENSDVVILLNVEQKRGTDDYYLTFKRTKLRYKDLYNVDYFNHPFAKGGRIKLVNDVNMKKSLSELSLSSDFEAIDLESKRGKKNAVNRDVNKEIMSAAGSDVFDFNKGKGKTA